MRSAWALMRASWLSATSYRLRIVLSFVGLVFSVVPMYFVASAIDPLAQDAIAAQADTYFAFVLMGMIILTFVGTAVTTLPGQISGGITTGTLEALISTRTGLPALMTGMMAYPLVWTGVRAGLMLVVGSFLGVGLDWSAIPTGLLIVALIVVAHIPFGVIGAALIVAFRTAGPLGQGVLFVAGALGGVYYPVSSVPEGWLQSIAGLVPLTYGLRPLRQVMLMGDPLSSVMADLAILAAFAVGLMALACFIFVIAFRYARRAGTLTQY